MADTLSEYFADDQNCYADLTIVREKWGLTTTTDEEWAAMKKTVGLMLIHCSENIQIVVHSHFDQLIQRMDMLGIEV